MGAEGASAAISARLKQPCEELAQQAKTNLQYNREVTFLEMKFTATMHLTFYNLLLNWFNDKKKNPGHHSKELKFYWILECQLH